jgi:hypothetical protein
MQGRYVCSGWFAYVCLPLLVSKTVSSVSAQDWAWEWRVEWVCECVCEWGLLLYYRHTVAVFLTHCLIHSLTHTPLPRSTADWSGGVHYSHRVLFVTLLDLTSLDLSAWFCHLLCSSHLISALLKRALLSWVQFSWVQLTRGALLYTVLYCSVLFCTVLYCSVWSRLCCHSYTIRFFRFLVR